MNIECGHWVERAREFGRGATAKEVAAHSEESHDIEIDWAKSNPIHERLGDKLQVSEGFYGILL